MFKSVIVPGGEIEVTVLQGDGEYIVRIPIGVDGDTKILYSLFVALSPVPGQADIPGFELVFSIVGIKAGDGSETVFWDGRQSRAVIGDLGDRTMIRSVLRLAIGRLIDEASPGLVSMTTHEPALPERALDKFNEIAYIFRTKNYDARQADPWHGRRIWMMQRLQ